MEHCASAFQRENKLMWVSNDMQWVNDEKTLGFLGELLT